MSDFKASITDEKYGVKTQIPLEHDPFQIPGVFQTAINSQIESAEVELKDDAQNSMPYHFTTQHSPRSPGTLL